jgi:carboxypeptidase T
MGYLTADGIEAAIQHIALTYPSIAQAIELPETSVEGRTCRALKIGKGGGNRRGVLFLGGVHAREVVNPDLLVMFALDLCEAYAAGGDLILLHATYPAAFIKLIVEGMDVFIFPLVNPDGRAYVQEPGGDSWWRKNRAFHPDSGCYGVDINRNFGFLWPSGIGTSANPCDYQIYKGPSAFSEPETRNVRWLLDAHPNIMGMIDIHSYDNDLLLPWGDGTDQEGNPSENFHNPAYDGLRGVANSSLYGDYLPRADLDWYTSVGHAVQSAIQAAFGTVYTVKQSIQLYPTSGTSQDYAYSRSFVNPESPRVYAYTLETGTEFQPTYAKAILIMFEVAAGLVQFCLECVCAVTGLAGGTALADRLDPLRTFRDEELLTTPAGARLAEALVRHGAELTRLLLADGARRDRATELLAATEAAATSGTPLDPELVAPAEALAVDLAAQASPELRAELATVVRDAAQFKGLTIPDALRALGG